MTKRGRLRLASVEPSMGALLHRAHQALERSRFRNVSIKSSLRRLFYGAGVAPSGIGNQIRLIKACVGSNASRDLISVHLRHT